MGAGGEVWALKPVPNLELCIWWTHGRLPLPTSPMTVGARPADASQGGLGSGIPIQL